MLPRMAGHGARLHLALRLLAMVLVAVAVVLVAGTGVALLLAPAVLLAVPLLVGRYPGRRVVHRLARRRAVLIRAVRCAVVPRAPRLLGAHVAALALPGAGRAPPVALI
jgi:hypothetical protein